MFTRKENNLDGQGLESGEDTGTGTLLWVLLWALALILVQQWYARTHNYGIEQPVGLFGLAEYFFRHPEKLICLLRY